MIKSIILSLIAFTGINRAIVTVPTIQFDGSYYYSDINNSNTWNYLNNDGDNLYFTFNLNTAIDSNGNNSSDDELVSNNNQGNGGSVVLYSWSNVDYNIQYDNSGAYDPQLTFDSNSRYISAVAVNDDTSNQFTQTLLNHNDYFLSFNLSSSEQFVYVFYNVSYRSNLTTNTYYTYNGYINVDTINTAVVNIPYRYVSNPNYFNDYYVNASITLVLPSMTGYNQGYSDGYNNGYNTGYTTGQGDGFNTGYNSGYNTGFTNGTNSASNFADLLFTIADTPIYYLKSMFNFELFGVNVAVAILSLMSVGVAVYVVKKVI